MRPSVCLDHCLDHARTVGDPLVDALVGHLERAPRGCEIDAALARYCRSGEIARGLPRPLARFLEDERVPAWAEPGRLASAARFAERNSLAIACALFCAALPAAFTGAKGVSVLQATRRVRDDLDRRVNETGRFVFDVVMPGGFTSGRAVRSAKCVRLMHAVVRSRVGARLRAKRREASGEVPINQEDLLGTLTCFSVVVIDALDKLGVPFTSAEAEDYLHLWRVVGALLGIREAWLPEDIAGARALGATIRERQAVATVDGRELTRVLVDGVERHLPARGLGLLAPGLIRWFLGDASADILGLAPGLRRSDLAGVLPRVGGALRALGRGVFGAGLPVLGRNALEHVMLAKLRGAEPRFYRPLGAGERRP